MDALAAYDSGSDADSEPAPAPVPKKKRLPPPPPALLPPAPPADDPAQHQGRTRTAPHVVGQFAAHVFVSAWLDDDGDEGGLVREVVEAVEGGIAVHGGGGAGDEEGEGEEGGGEALHVSLSRVVYLRAHQRAAFRTAVKALAGECAPFTASFATFTTLTNDTRTRAFLALEVGAGHAALAALAAGLEPAVRAVHQEAFYARPRFHASVVWALMPRGEEGAEGGKGAEGGTGAEGAEGEGAEGTPLDAYVPTLQTQLGARLLRAGTFRVDALRVRIGREEHVYALRGRAGPG